MPRWPDLTVEERFWAKVERSAGCWIWKGAKRDKAGYGSFRIASKQAPAKAHRYVWELTYGPIPPGLLVMHICDNPSCVNPKHLSLGTNASNALDSSLKSRRHGGRNVGARNGISRLTEDQVREIRRRFATGEMMRPLASEYGVCWGTIRYVVKGGGWKHVA